jgi:hypothetical protein
MPAPTGVWFTSRAAIRNVSIGGSAKSAFPDWFYTGPSVAFKTPKKPKQGK